MSRRRALSRREPRVRSAPVKPPMDEVIGFLPAPARDWVVYWFMEDERQPCIGFAIYGAVPFSRSRQAASTIATIRSK
jgi:hypothetical protein